MSAPILVAGIGNIFFGDDGFGVEVVRRLRQRPLPANVRLVDVGIRGLDLTYALTEAWSAVVLIDAMPRGGKPGTLYVLEPEPQEGAGQALLEPHAMDPVRVLAAARSLGATVSTLRVVGCEPAFLGSEEELAPGLSAEVEAAVEPAVAMVESLLLQLGEAAHA